MPSGLQALKLHYCVLNILLALGTLLVASFFLPPVRAEGQKLRMQGLWTNRCRVYAPL